MEIENQMQNMDLSKPAEHLPLVLTRYLYIKHDVYVSLLFSILKKDYPQAMFWGCELYYSGWEEDACSFVYSIYNQWFKPVNDPRLFKYIDDLDDRFQEGPHILASMIKNMTMPWVLWTSEYFLKDYIDTPIPSFESYINKKCIIVKVESYELEHYKTVECNSKSKILSKNLLSNVCHYSSEKQYINLFGCVHRFIPKNELIQEHRDHWMFYCALYTPIWIDRILEHNGKIDPIQKTVVFDTENEFEIFYEKYNYDLDEQPLMVQEKMIHLEKSTDPTHETLYALLDSISMQLRNYL